MTLDRDSIGPQHGFRHPRLMDPWSQEVVSWSPSGGRLVVADGDGRQFTVDVNRCAVGRLRDAYPVAEHDVEVIIDGSAAEYEVTELLSVVVTAIWAADPDCRKVVFGVERAELDSDQESTVGVISAAEAAGLRYVLDVDIVGSSLSLLVAEPEWVTKVDVDTDRIPGT